MFRSSISSSVFSLTACLLHRTVARTVARGYGPCGMNPIPAPAARDEFELPLGLRRLRRVAGQRAGLHGVAPVGSAVRETVGRAFLLFEVGVSGEPFVVAAHQQRRFLQRQQTLAERLLVGLAHALHEVATLV